jgi:hypothetical protein
MRMRSEYVLRNGQPNPYLKKLGVRGRNELVAWWANVSERVRVLPEDVAAAFPDTDSTVEALRIVMRLRDIDRRPRSRRARRAPTKRAAAPKSRGRLGNGR